VEYGCADKVLERAPETVRRPSIEDEKE